MPAFSKLSAERLATCDPRLQAVLNEVIKHFDCSVVFGHRTKAEQDQAVAEGRSKTPWPSSKHNAQPSLAVDVVPYPIEWADRERHHYFAGWVMAIAAAKGITLRWGGDWSRDTQVRDNGFDDLVHFEIVQ